MGDVALTLLEVDGIVSNTADMRIVADDVEADEGLRTATYLSLFTDRRAEADDVLPGQDGDRRGWWGDEFAEVEGDRHGSRLWLLARSKRTADIDPLAEQYAREALQWMINDLVVEKIDVVSTDGNLEIIFHRPDQDPTKFRFAHVWAGEEAR